MPTPGFDKGAGSALVLPTQLGTIPGNAGYGWQKTAKATDVGLPGLVLPGCQGYYEADLITGVSNGAQITA
ncbi:MAG TPA: hypothetical protein VJS20_11570, partial [Gemmatimonadales bacterium]|nr:hypothetical protein [Gemmatimonadales bacterium]